MHINHKYYDNAFGKMYLNCEGKSLKFLTKKADSWCCHQMRGVRVDCNSRGYTADNHARLLGITEVTEGLLYLALLN